MDDALRIHEFLPVSYANKNEEAYVKFLWDAFDFNYNNDKYEFANLAFHLLYMSFACFSVWQIRAARRADFDKAMVGFQNDVESKLATADTPFKFFENLRETTIFRFIKLVGCTNEQVGEFSKFVKQRNRIAHPSGTVFFNSKDNIDEHIAQIMTEIDRIQSHMGQTIHDCMRKFLVENWNADDWQFSVPKDQIDSALIHANYFSYKDIDAALLFDITSLQGEPNYEAMAQLFETFKRECKQDE